MDEEEEVRHNFGDSFHSVQATAEVGGDDTSTTTDEEEEEEEEPVEIIRNVVGKNDWSEAEVEVENWKRARKRENPTRVLAVAVVGNLVG